LRSLVPLRDGDILDVSNLREAFDALKKLYASSGWIDFTPTPNFDIDDDLRRVDLTLELDQEHRYRVGRINILGENPPAEKILRSMFKTGEPFNRYLLSQFLHRR
jgi:outer membrane protein assembly factor BamA